MAEQDADAHAPSRTVLIREAVADADSGEVYARFDLDLAIDNVLALFGCDRWLT